VGLRMNVTCPHCGGAWLAPTDVTPIEEMLLFLVREMRADGAAPSLEEMNFYFGFSPASRSQLFAPISALIRKGMLVKGRLFSSLTLTPIGETAIAGRPLRSPGSRALSLAARELSHPSVSGDGAPDVVAAIGCGEVLP